MASFLIQASLQAALKRLAHNSDFHSLHAALFEEYQRQLAALLVAQGEHSHKLQGYCYALKQLLDAIDPHAGKRE